MARTPTSRSTGNAPVTSSAPLPKSGVDHSAFPALDGVRAVAVIAVVVTHAAYWTGRYEHGFAAPLLARLDVGVALFFVLSGFLLSRAWLAAAVSGGPPPSLRRYAWRRALRILPVYWLTVAVALTVLPENRGAGPADWLRHAALLQIYRTGWFRQGLTQTWSLATEAAFYAVLPAIGAVIMWLTRRRGWSPAALLTGCTVLVLASVVWYELLSSTGWAFGSQGRFWLPGYLGWFAGGIAMAIIRTELDRDPAPSSTAWRVAADLGGRPGLVWAFAAAALLLLLTPIAGPRAIGAPTGPDAVVKSLGYLVVAVAFVWPTVFGRSSAVDLLLGNRVMRGLGRISYSVFLLHLVVLEAVVHLLGYRLFTGSALPVAVLTLAATSAVSVVTYRLVELPFLELSHPGRPGTTGRLRWPTRRGQQGQ